MLNDFVYACVTSYEYWRLNPGQDDTDMSQSPPDPIKVATRRRFESTSTATDADAEFQGAANGEKQNGSAALHDETVAIGGARPNDSVV